MARAPSLQSVRPVKKYRCRYVSRPHVRSSLRVIVFLIAGHMFIVHALISTKSSGIYAVVYLPIAGAPAEVKRRAAELGELGLHWTARALRHACRVIAAF